MESPDCEKCTLKGICNAYEEPKAIDFTCYYYLTISLDRLRELAEAGRDGRLVVLPCKVGDTVYTIEQHYLDCDNCEQECREFERGQHCPCVIKEHIVEGFYISDDGLSAPGEWDYEGLECFRGIDGKWYLTRDAAVKALEEKK